MFPTRVPVSEFTQQAFEGHIKALESLTFFSKTDLYAILSSERADHLLYGRELHRGLCVCNPRSAREYRELLAADAEIVSPRAGQEMDAPDHGQVVADALAVVTGDALKAGQAERQRLYSQYLKNLSAYVAAGCPVPVEDENAPAARCERVGRGESLKAVEDKRATA